MKIYVVRVKDITNKLLIQDGWKVGSVVREIVSGWTHEPTMELCNDGVGAFYFNPVEAQSTSEKIQREALSGVTLEVVTFVEVKET